MLTPGTTKTGKAIWAWCLHSARKTVCGKGWTKTCRKICYDRRAEKRGGDKATKRRRRNFKASKRDNFVALMVATVLALQCGVVRIHTGGEFYSAEYAEKWLQIIRLCPLTRFYFYTRTWRDKEIGPVIEKMARRRNCRVWYSVDRELVGLLPPADKIPKRVRLCYLQVEEDDLPPRDLVDLVFRTHKLRKRECLHVEGVRVCPSEDGKARTKKVTCDGCDVCHKSEPLPKGALTLGLDRLRALTQHEEVVNT